MLFVTLLIAVFITPCFSEYKYWSKDEGIDVKMFLVKLNAYNNNPDGPFNSVDIIKDGEEINTDTFKYHYATTRIDWDTWSDPNMVEDSVFMKSGTLASSYCFENTGGDGIGNDIDPNNIDPANLPDGCTYSLSAEFDDLAVKNPGDGGTRDDDPVTVSCAISVNYTAGTPTPGGSSCPARGFWN